MSGFSRALRSTATLTAVAFVAATLWPHGAHAQQPAAPAGEDPALATARQHFEAGRAAYNSADYAGAIREFKLAEQVRPSPILDYNIGLANEKLGKRRVAVKYYKRYLQNSPQANNRAQVEATIGALERDIAASPGTQPVEQPSDQPPPPPPGYQGGYQQQPPPPGGYQGGYQQQPAYQGYDPYGQPAQALPPAPPTRRSYWWVALIVVGAVVLITVAVVAWYFTAGPGASVTTFGLDNAPAQKPLPLRPEAPAFMTPSHVSAPAVPMTTLFRF